MIYLVLCILIVATLLRVEATAMSPGANKTIDKEIASMMKHIKALELRLNQTELLLAEKITLLEAKVQSDEQADEQSWIQTFTWTGFNQSELGLAGADANASFEITGIGVVVILSALLLCRAVASC